MIETSQEKAEHQQSIRERMHKCKEERKAMT
jgi:hypothetical protein